MIRYLVTGINGFVGSHMVDFLNLQEDSEVYGITRWRSNRENFKYVKGKYILLDGDLMDLGSLIRLLDALKPDVIFHLAAQSYVVSSFNYPHKTISTNTLGTLNLLEAVRILKQDPIIHICGSSEVYGMVDEKYLPIKEDCPFNPSSPYSVGKIGEDMVALQYFNSYKIKTIRTRAFSHTGPRRGEVFAASSFTKQLAAIKLGLQKNEIYVGNLDSVRTFMDVRDTVRAYWLIAMKGVPGEVYNIGGQETMTIREMLEKAMKIADLTPEIKQLNRLMRPSDVTLQIPCTDKFAKQTGWQPEFTFQQTLIELFKYWLIELMSNPWKHHPQIAFEGNA